jgi:hypothetical protein
VLLNLFAPVAIICIVLAGDAIMHCLRHRSASQAQPQFAGMVMSAVFVFLPTWLRTTFSLFSCIQLDLPADWPYQAEAVGTWWVEDLSQQCFSPNGYHMRWALGPGIPMVLLLCLVLPGGMLLFMWHSRKHGKLTIPEFEHHYGFMYQLWRAEVCWYEAIILLQTTALVVVATFGFGLGAYYQVLVTTAVLGVVVVMMQWVRPFKCPAAGAVAMQSACVLLLTSYTVLTFLPYIGVEPGLVYSNIMGAILLLFNVVFLGRMIWKLTRSDDWSHMTAAVHRTMGICGGVAQQGKGQGQGPLDKDVGVLVP